MSMRFKLLLPTEILLDAPVRKIVAEARDGSFGILPRHVDFVAALVPGVLVYVDADGIERFVGIDEGMMVKRADEVMASTRNAVIGDDLESLKQLVRQRFVELDERERSVRSAIGRLEAGVVRRFIELQERL
jgi:F-type H+-transporting ATPase subunit epsilon